MGGAWPEPHLQHGLPKGRQGSPPPPAVNPKGTSRQVSFSGERGGLEVWPAGCRGTGVFKGSQDEEGMGLWADDAPAPASDMFFPGQPRQGPDRKAGI